MESAVIFRSQAGKTVQKTVLSPGEEPTVRSGMTGSDQPDGEWTLTGVGTRMALVNSFPKDQVTRCLVNWSRVKPTAG